MNILKVFLWLLVAALLAVACWFDQVVGLGVTGSLPF